VRAAEQFRRPHRVLDRTGSYVNRTMSTHPTFTPFAAESYSSGFWEYWTKAFRNTDNVVLLAVGVGVVCLAIILSSGKWRK
jgi:hypothetical protein